MKFIRFTTTPTHGTVLELRGQSYVMVGTKRYLRKDGLRTEVLQWASHCSECGQPFEVTSSLVIGYLNRRCPQHHRPGRVATTTSSQRPEEARHGS
jgi:hypothetical protein